MHGRAHIALDAVETALAVPFNDAQQAHVLDHKVLRIVHAAEEKLRLAGIRVEQVDALYFTGGSTGL